MTATAHARYMPWYTKNQFVFCICSTFLSVWPVHHDRAHSPPACTHVIGSVSTCRAFSGAAVWHQARSSILLHGKSSDCIRSGFLGRSTTHPQSTARVISAVSFTAFLEVYSLITSITCFHSCSSLGASGSARDTMESRNGTCSMSAGLGSLGDGGARRDPRGEHTEEEEEEDDEELLLCQVRRLFLLRFALSLLVL